MVTFAAIDVVIVLLFVIAILSLGFSAKLRDSSLLQYLVAGRSLTLPMFVSTLVCTWYGGILGMGESVSYYGYGTFLMLAVPYYVFALVYAFFLAKKVRGAEEISIPERLRQAYGKPVALAGALLIFLLAIPSAHVLMLGIMVELLTGWNLWTSIIVAALGGSLFLYKGGLLADVRASMLAFVMMYIGFLVIVAVCVRDYPPATAFAPLKSQPLGSWAGGQSFTMILSFFLLGAWTLVDPGFHQRVASASTPAQGQKGVLICVFFWFLFDVLSITTGLYAVTLIQDKPANMLMLFPLLGNQVLAPGLKAAFFCGILGTVLCAMVSYSLVSGATFGREFIGTIRPEIPEPHIKNWTRVGIALSVVLAALIGKQVESVVAIWYAWGGVVTGALLIPVLLAYARPNRRPTSGVTFAAIVAAFAVSLSGWIIGMRNANPYLTIQWLGQDFSLGTLIPGLIVSALVIGLGSLATHREQTHG